MSFVPAATPARPRWQGGRFFVITLVVLAVAGVGAFSIFRDRQPAPKAKSAAPLPVVSALVGTVDLPVRLSANGTVSAVQSVEVRPQISATIKAVHVKEGQFVQAGQRLFSLDVRTEEANIGKAEAQVEKSRTDLGNAERNLKRQRELFEQKFISQTALDTVQSQVDSLRAQLAADRATVEASRVARGFGDIVAPIGGRLGAIAVYPGSLVQPAGPALVSISQIDPINVSFSLPESELPALQKSLAAGGIAVNVQLDEADRKGRSGRLSFIDNNVDTASGTIRLKATFANGDGRLWPGMFVTVTLAPRIVAGALVVPVQAVQTGPENKFVYVIGEDGKVSPKPVRVSLVQDGRAVIEGAPAGTRVVVEGAQNLKPGSLVAEAGTGGGGKAPAKAADKGAEKPAQAVAPKPGQS